MEALRAAVENGADAVYLGGKEFNARRSAANFSREELKEATYYTHLKGVNLYVTVNILISDEEMEKAADFVDFLYSIGVDGIIVQDLGFGAFIKRNFPHMEVHGSTQMTIHNAESVKALENLKFDRVVLARELSLDEIRRIKSSTSMKIETFIHGALCFCYSGQCLMSSFIGSRSGNRGQCAQPCRLPYALVDEKGNKLTEKLHLLSPRDLKLIDHLPRLIEAGIDSFKIEGRLKRPEYVALVTSVYRQAMDRYLEAPERYNVPPEDESKLARIFNRDFTTGYYFGNPGAKLMSVDCPRNKGVFLGKVTGYDRKRGFVKILLEDHLHVGDGVDFRGKEGFGYVVTEFFVNGRKRSQAGPGEIVELRTREPIPRGTPIYKTSDTALLSEVRKTYTDPKLARKVPVDVEVSLEIGKPMMVKMTDPEGSEALAYSEKLVQQAEKHPLDERTVRGQIDRLGNTIFFLRNFTARIEKGAMLPFSSMNDTRRKAVAQLGQLRLARHIKPPVEKSWRDFIEEVYRHPGIGKSSALKLSARVDNVESARAAIFSGVDIIYFGGENFSETKKHYKEVRRLADGCGCEFYLALPRIVDRKTMGEFENLLDETKLVHGEGVLAGNLGVIISAVKRGIKAVADFSLNTFNSVSLKVLNELGVSRVVLSPELSLNQIGQLAAPLPIECLVHGRLPLMVSEHNLIKANIDSNERKVGLKDRIGKVFPVVVDERGRSHIYNCYELCMINHLEGIRNAGVNVGQLYLIGKEAGEVERLVKAYKNALVVKEKIDEKTLTGAHTYGHFFRGVK
ncbi:peptidase U32 [Thermosediminibacter oceani DSM 16646]|uniref:Peptidase U32 n=2 Tax=Thermosediminibacter TaxID=291988 RepID=D9RXS4_THEOJ|nr:peptidase U32 [Thermosediminibacter oceani DSM 16646]